LELLLPVGLAPSKVAASAELIASALGVLSVLVEPSTLAANRLRLVAQATDPLAQPITDPWPWLDAQSVSFFGSPIPAGVDEAGQLVTVAMAENNLLIAGEPGGGKSATLAQFVAAAALDPRVRLYLLDGKVVELGIFRAAADGFADNLPAATRLLVDVRAEMQKRYELLSYTRARKSDLAAVDFEPLVVVVDELAFFTSGASADKKAAGEFESLLRDLVARGRAAGVVVFLCTQRPSADIISTSLRDLVRTRVALRCTTPQASDTVLGSGMASRGFSAQSIAQGQPGTFLLFDEGAAAPRRVRSFFLTDAQLLDIADRAALARMAYHLERPNPTDLAAE
jgi:S-DNA-T family DNA segregation ATPase FtsK/SpoIIIE